MALDFAQPALDREKLLAAVHWICANSDSEKLGKLKLHKILYFADMLYFAASGAPMTGVEYQKQKFGPTARHLTWALKELQARGLISIEAVSYWGFLKYKFVSLKEFSSNRLSDREILLLKAIVGDLVDRSAEEVSELSHRAPWELVEFGETIPYESCFLLQEDEITDDDVAWGISTAKEVFGGAGDI